ncbi:hypothetical protein DMN91_004805 [Ooceraea biroi]|uniref:Uncharacterized protein n=1 Tax=Ooceraea biroi TaxID=2015173 RepID=A0A3L8DQ50_OOCBI|nr:uncharacterized protein LOC105281035 [Ooceraea biroi]RLU22527.1 hypothetical protein DMN91_004805 [Ooceraea biroi]
MWSSQIPRWLILKIWRECTSRGAREKREVAFAGSRENGQRDKQCSSRQAVFEVHATTLLSKGRPWTSHDIKGDVIVRTSSAAPAAAAVAAATLQDTPVPRTRLSRLLQLGETRNIAGGCNE